MALTQLQQLRRSTTAAAAAAATHSSSRCTLVAQQLRRSTAAAAAVTHSSRCTVVAVRAAAASTPAATATPQQQQKRVVISGGNTGIGFETSKVLLGQGHAVTLACRDDAKAAAAVAALKQNQPGAAVDSVRLDLASLASVRDAAASLLDNGRPIDVLLNNAGVMACPRMTTADGYEYQLGVNHLGHFLWTNQLLPLLQSNPNPVRVINVASIAHLAARKGIDFDDLQSEREYDRWVAYGQSKLANIVFSYELARRLQQQQPGSSITVNALHPGVVRTELPRYLITDPDSLGARILTALATPFTLSPEEGARTSIYLASSPDVEGVTGKYFDTCKPVPSSPISYDLSVGVRFWDVSRELTEGALARAAAAAAHRGGASAAANQAAAAMV